MSDPKVNARNTFASAVRAEQRTEIPDWARFVAVDGDGVAWVFEAPPELRTGKRFTFWMKATGTRCAALSTENGAFRLSDLAVSRLVFPLTSAEER